MVLYRRLRHDRSHTSYRYKHMPSSFSSCGGRRLALAATLVLVADREEAGALAVWRLGERRLRRDPLAAAGALRDIALAALFLTSPVQRGVAVLGIRAAAGRVEAAAQRR